MHKIRAAAALLVVSSLWGASAQPVAPQQASTACPAIPLAGADAGAVRTPSAADAWGGERSNDAATLSNRVVADGSTLSSE